MTGGSVGSGRRERIAVIGSGIAGLTAAYLLQRRYDVTLFEADDRLGGHAHTHDVPTPDGRLVPVDSGFIVHNQRTYPHLLRLFDELEVPTRESEMSMSIRCAQCGLQYAGARGIAGIAARPSWLARPRFLRLLYEVTRFHRHARRVLLEQDEALTLGEFVRAGGYSRFFATHFLLPFVSAVWSSGMGTARHYPAGYLFRFLDHHGMLQVTGSPVWRTVQGGSRTYVDRAVKSLTAVAAATPVRAVHRHSDAVEIRDDADEVHTADRVVLATHPDQALTVLADPTDAERAVLGAFEYSVNPTVLHTDNRVLPSAGAARASWNYLLPACEPPDDRVHVSYHLNRLQRLSEPVDYVVTLNESGLVDPGSIIERMVYTHPIYTPESVLAQQRLPELNGARTAYAGAYHGWGFHEDGCRSGVAAARAFGVDW